MSNSVSKDSENGGVPSHLRVREVSLAPPSDPVLRRALRVLAMTHELHKAGYQRLRIAAGMAPSGTHWRCDITSADNVDKDGWSPRDEHLCAHFSTGQGEQYFGWADGAGKSARQLAHMFVNRFPQIARRGTGQDRVYAGWFVDMLGAAENGRLPIFYADWDISPNPLEMPTAFNP